MPESSPKAYAAQEVNKETAGNPGDNTIYKFSFL